MKIQIYGPGCDKCKKLASNVEEAVKRLQLDAEICKVTEIEKITEAGVMLTPALEIDHKIISSGKVLTVEDIAKLLNKNEAVAETLPAQSANDQSACDCRSNIWKKCLTTLLLLLVASSIIAMVIREMTTKDESSNPQNATIGMIAEDTVVVYYFHGNQRCWTCNRIEELTKEVLAERFQQNITDSTIVMLSINVDKPENEHFVKDFQLSSRTVLMQKYGRYEKFDDVWTNVRDPEKFKAYIQEGVIRMLKSERDTSACTN